MNQIITNIGLVLSIILSIGIGSTSNAQVVQVSDKYLLELLINLGYDSNNNGQIERNEALRVDTIKTISHGRITDVSSLRSFPNLKYADLRDQRISKGLDFSHNSKLNYLVLDGNWLTSLKLERSPSLIHLSCNGTAVFSIDISGASNIRTLSADDCPNLGYINFSQNSRLNNFSCSNMKASLLDNLYTCRELEEIRIPRSHSSAFDASKFANLRVLDLYQSQVAHVDISSNLKIEEVYSSGSILGLENVDKFRNLKALIYTNYVYGNVDYGYKSLDFSSNVNLEYLSLRRETIENLDLSNNSKLKSLDISFCRSLKRVNIQNGSVIGLPSQSVDYVSKPLNMRKCDKLESVCLDQGELSLVTSALGSKASSTALSTSNCNPSRTIQSTQVDQGIALTHTLIFPNPVKDVLNIRSPNKIEAITLYTINGVKVKDLPAQNEVAVDNLPSGVYFLMLTSNQKKQPYKFVKE